MKYPPDGRGSWAEPIKPGLFVTALDTICWIVCAAILLFAVFMPDHMFYLLGAIYG